MSKIELTDEELEIEVQKLLPWSSKRYKNGRRDVHSSMLEDGEIYDWMTRRYTKKLAVEAVKEAGEYYKLNVELTAGYMLGTNWATCH